MAGIREVMKHNPLVCEEVSLQLKAWFVLQQLCVAAHDNRRSIQPAILLIHWSFHVQFNVTLKTVCLWRLTRLSGGLFDFFVCLVDCFDFA